MAQSSQLMYNPAGMNRLLHLERWIEQLVEEPFVRLFAGRLLPQFLATLKPLNTAR